MNKKSKQKYEGVGENMQDHLQLRLIYKVSNCKTLNTMSRSLFGITKIGL